MLWICEWPSSRDGVIEATGWSAQTAYDLAKLRVGDRSAGKPRVRPVRMEPMVVKEGKAHG